MKLCKDCKHSEIHLETYDAICRCPIEIDDYVFGRTIARIDKSCYTARNNTNDLCGVEAKY